MMAENARHLKEESALHVTRESVWSSQCVLLAYTSDGEWLARETREQDVMAWHSLGWYLANVTCDRMVCSEIDAVGLLRVLVPLRRENALAAYCLKALSDPTNTGKKINESKLTPAGSSRRKGLLSH